MSQFILRHMQQQNVRALVVGDIMLDRHIRGVSKRVSPEAPAPVLESPTTSQSLGGAGAVASILRGWEVAVEVVGTLGNDLAGKAVRHMLNELGVGHDGVLSLPDRETTQKDRFEALGSFGRHLLLRLDRETLSPLSDSCAMRLIRAVRKAVERTDVVLVSDYGKGVCEARLLEAVMEASAKRGVPVLVDPSRHARFSDYCGATWIKPNRVEAEMAVGRSIATPADAEICARELGVEAGMKVLVTLDRDGLVFFDGAMTKHVRGPAIDVVDVAGAGDAAFAAMAVGIAAGATSQEVARFVNDVAAREVGVHGVAQVALANAGSQGPQSKIVQLETARRLVEARRDIGEQVVFTNGCFDMLHFGHVQMLAEAAQHGDVLVVGLNSDESVSSLKGPMRPVIGEDQRAMMLASLACVDMVVIFDAPTPSELLGTIRPDVLVKGGATKDVVGREFVESYGGRVELTREVNGISTTQLIRIASQRGELE